MTIGSTSLLKLLMIGQCNTVRGGCSKVSRCLERSVVVALGSCEKYTSPSRTKQTPGNTKTWLQIRYSCETQLVATVHDLLGMLDVGTLIDMVILDFSKAFDTVPHQKLLFKMKQYGVDGNINALLCDFLTNRKMRVVIDGEESEAVPVDSGVPQGTVLVTSYFCVI